MNGAAALASPKSSALALLALSVLLAGVFAVNSLSAYIRHVESGLECQPWPACYGVVGQHADRESERAASMQALTPHSVVKKWHRALASVMVLLLAVVLVQTTGKRAQANGLDLGDRLLPYAMALVMVVLAVVGPSSHLKTLPIIALINLVGGVTLLALVWRLVLSVAATSHIATDARTWALSRHVVWVVLAQIALGAWVSANFAGAACGEVFACVNQAGTRGGLDAFWPFRALTLDGTGRIVMDGGTWWIHVVHRLAAVGVAAYLAFVGFALWRATPAVRGDVLILLLLLGGQVGLGVASVAQKLPLNAVLLHHLTASMLLLAAIRIRYRIDPGGTR